MKFLVDAQLSRRLTRVLREQGHEAWHTLDLPAGNETTDAEVARWGDAQDAIVVSKDHDFMTSRALNGVPRKLCLLRFGNCDNDTLIALVSKHLGVLEWACLEKVDTESGGFDI